MTAKLETTEQLAEAIAVLAQGHTELEAVVKAQGELLRSMDEKIKTLVKAIDRLVGPPKAGFDA